MSNANSPRRPRFSFHGYAAAVVTLGVPCWLAAAWFALKACGF